MADISGSKGNGNGVTFTYIIRCTETEVDTTNNRRKVKFQLIAKQSWSGLMYSQWGTGVTLVVNGTTKIDNYAQRKLDGSGEHIYYTHEEWFNGNADGSFSITVSGKWYQNSPDYFVSGGVSASGTFTGTKITIVEPEPEPEVKYTQAWINVDGVWIKAFPYYNNNGTWVKGKPWFNEGGTWKE